MNANFVNIGLKGSSDEFTIIPIELHYSNRTKSNGFCRKTWTKLLRRIERDPKCLVVFCGDTIDADRPSLRDRKSVMYADRMGALEEEDLDHQRGLREGLIKDLKRIKGKIIGMLDGDHFRQYANNTTSTWYIANQLGIPKTYLGQRMGWVRLNFNREKATGSSCNFDILVRHGVGGTGAFGNDVNTLIRQSNGFIADLHLGGHTHKSWFIKVPHLYLGKYEIKEKLVAYARAGSLLRGFMFGHTTYAEIAEYNPLSIGCPEIKVKVGRKEANNLNLQVVDIKGLT